MEGNRVKEELAAIGDGVVAAVGTWEGTGRMVVSGDVGAKRDTKKKKKTKTGEHEPLAASLVHNQIREMKRKTKKQTKMKIEATIVQGKTAAAAAVMGERRMKGRSPGTNRTAEP